MTERVTLEPPRCVHGNIAMMCCAYCRSVLWGRCVSCHKWECVCARRAEYLRQKEKRDE